MNLFIAGICGTFMAGIAQLARARGDRVSGCDDHVYPPMSTLLADAGIEVLPGYRPEHLPEDVDEVVIGNALSRGNPLVESVLDADLAFTSGPQWLHDRVLTGRRVIAVAGTHGKTTTSSMLAWMLHDGGVDAGYLVGGKPGNFDASAHAGTDDRFVIEADEYDSAFFDKRSKFVHYRPAVAVLNNLEFDHADIFDDLEDIKKQFHYLVRIVPPRGHVIANADDANVEAVLERGCWSRVHRFSIRDTDCEWFAAPARDDHREFDVYRGGEKLARVRWECIGRHNMQNALAALAAAAAAGMDVAGAARSLAGYRPSKRRLQLLFGNERGRLYEDFAHHPTAIAATIDAVRGAHPGRRLVVILEPRSNTMKSGVHGERLARSLDGADEVYIFQSAELGWDPARLDTPGRVSVHRDSAALLDEVEAHGADNCVIICMSNSGFDGIPGKLRQRLESAPT